MHCPSDRDWNVFLSVGGTKCKTVLYKNKGIHVLGVRQAARLPSVCRGFCILGLLKHLAQPGPQCTSTAWGPHWSLLVDIGRQWDLKLKINGNDAMIMRMSMGRQVAYICHVPIPSSFPQPPPGWVCCCQEFACLLGVVWWLRGWLRIILLLLIVILIVILNYGCAYYWSLCEWAMWGGGTVRWSNLAPQVLEMC